jgi:hypothetical protein
MTFDEIVRAHYFHEAERRRDLNSSLSIPLGVLTALFAAIVAMLGGVSAPINSAEWILLGLCTLAASAGVGAIYFVIRSYLGYSYAHPTSMGPLVVWREEALTKGIAVSQIEADINRIMSDQYANAAERNALNNDDKSGYIHNAGEWLTACLVLVIAAGVVYTIHRVTGGAETMRPVGHPTSVELQIGANCEPQRRPAGTFATPATPSPSAPHADNPRERGTEEIPLRSAAPAGATATGRGNFEHCRSE